MSRPFDASRSLTALEQDNTIIAAIIEVAACRRDAEMSLAALKPTEEPRASILDQVHLQAWMLSASIVNQKGREQVLDHLRCRGHPQDSSFATLELPRPLPECLRFGE